MFGKLSWSAIPIDQPIPLITSVVLVVVILGVLGLVTAKGWFAARPSGTEDVYKVYAESFESGAHLARIQAEAQKILSDHFASAKSTAG